MTGKQSGEPVSSMVLREVREDDLPVLFELQKDRAANYMAAFIYRDPLDREAFTAHWDKILHDNTVVLRTILYEGQIAGHICKFVMFDEPEVGYWVGKNYWGKGIATRALSEFIQIIKERPLFAHVAKDNAASIRVLKKCGFKNRGEGKAFSRIRDEEVEEYIFTLD